MTTDMTLYQVSEHLTALLDTIDIADPDQLPELEIELARAAGAEIAKVDGFAGYLRQLDAAIDFLKDRQSELATRRDALKRRGERLRRYVRTVIESKPRNSKGGYARLEGREFTMSLRAASPQAKITDEQLVPAVYKTLTITVPAAAWESHIQRYNDLRDLFANPGDGALTPSQPPKILRDIVRSECSINKVELLRDLKVGMEIPGAEQVYGDPSVQVK